MAKHALGRGLGALLQEDEISQQQKSPLNREQAESGELLIALERISPNPGQPRSEFNEESLKELAESIREHGIIEPPIVELLDDGNYRLVAGERRYRAAHIAGLKSIPVLVRSYSPERKFEIALIENIQRQDLNPIEEAQAYYKIMEMGNLAQDEVARRVGKNRSTVANALRLLKLPPDMRESLVCGKITAGHARALLSVLNEKMQRELFEKILDKGLSVREAEQYSASVNVKTKKMPIKPQIDSAPKDPDIATLEQTFIEKLGTKVRISGTLERGVIMIDYFSRDDLDRLYELLS